MVQVPPNISVKAGGSSGAAAAYLADIVGQQAAYGYEFYSIEEIGIVEEPGCGCLASLLGMKATQHMVYVVVFRRQRLPVAPPQVP
jgi:hypothetical protein